MGIIWQKLISSFAQEQALKWRVIINNWRYDHPNWRWSATNLQEYGITIIAFSCKLSKLHNLQSKISRSEYTATVHASWWKIAHRAVLALNSKLQYGVSLNAVQTIQVWVLSARMKNSCPFAVDWVDPPPLECAADSWLAQRNEDSDHPEIGLLQILFGVRRRPLFVQGVLTEVSYPLETEKPGASMLNRILTRKSWYKSILGCRHSVWTMNNYWEKPDCFYTYSVSLCFLLLFVILVGMFILNFS